jgi:hypothetical protein
VTNSNPIGAMLVADTTPEQGAQVRQALDEMLRERSGGDGPAVPQPDQHRHRHGMSAAGPFALGGASAVGSRPPFPDRKSEVP